jgi:sugar/nucleoside kinase (ribokinase family)
MARRERKTFLGVFGHVNLDWLVDASTTPPTEKGPFFGGVGGNIALAVAKFGLSVSLASIVGRNFPEEYRTVLKDAGVNLDHLETDMGTDTSTCRLTTYPDGREEKDMFNGPQNDDVRTPVEFVDDTDYIHISTGFPHPCLWLARNAHAAGCTVAFDPSADLKRYYDPTLLLAIIKFSDIYFMNENELDVTLRLLALRDATDLLDLVDVAIVTKGVRGSELITRKKRYLIPVVESGEVVDPTGAGDAYRAGFYAGLYHECPLPDCCLLGSVAASECVIKDGAQVGLDCWEDLVARFETAKQKVSVEDISDD